MKLLYLVFGLSFHLKLAVANKYARADLSAQEPLTSYQLSSGGNYLDNENFEDFEKEIQNLLGPLEDFLNQFHKIGRNSSGESFEKLLSFERADNTQCKSDLQKVEADAKLRKVYALKMVDSWGRPQSGVLEGNVKWPGSYYECKSANGEGIEGQYYTLFYGFRFMPSPLTIPIDIAIGTCWPKSCDNVTVSQLVPIVFPNLNLLTTVDSDLHNTYTASTVIAITLSLILLLWSLAGSSYHLYCYYKEITTDKRNKILMSLSVWENTLKICSTKTIPGAIPTLDGIRVITTAWVIFGHSYYFIGNNIDNAISMGNSLTMGYLYMVVINGTFSVDTFFCIGGLLVCYLTMKQLRKPQGPMFIPLMYMKRYLRLTPLYAYLILFSVGLYKFLGDGPYWKHTAERTQEQCQDQWWTNLLYITTMYPLTNTCFRWGWYLSNDMFFFILTPFIVLLMNFSLYVGIGLAVGILFTNIGIVSWLTQSNTLHPTGITSPQAFTYRYRFVLGNGTTWEQKYTTDIYHLPWCRIGAYIVGMLAGLLLFVWDKKVKMSKITIVLGWLISTCFGILIVYGIYGYTKNFEFMPMQLNVFYNAMSRPVWALCVCWVVVACTSGYGGPVTEFLDLKIFRVLSRLTYGAYLVHPLVLFWYSGTMEQPIHFSDIVLASQYIGGLVMSFVAAFVLAVFVEWPMQELCKLALPSKKPKGGKNDDQKNSKQINLQISDEWKSIPDTSAPSDGSEKSVDLKKNIYENIAYVGKDEGPAKDDKAHHENIYTTNL